LFVPFEHEFADAPPDRVVAVDSCEKVADARST